MKKFSYLFMRKNRKSNVLSFSLHVVVLQVHELHSLSVELLGLFVQLIVEPVQFLVPKKKT